MRSKPPPLPIPSLELGALLTLVQDSGHMHCMPPMVRGDSDPHIIVVLGLFSLHALGGGEPLLACDVDITNFFWNFILPPHYRQSFRIRVDDTAYAFKALLSVGRIAVLFAKGFNQYCMESAGARRCCTCLV